MKRGKVRLLGLIGALVIVSLSLLGAEVPVDPSLARVVPWLDLLHGDSGQREKALTKIEAQWQPDSPGMAIETIRFLGAGPERQALYTMLRAKTGFVEAVSWQDWVRWQWDQSTSSTETSLRLKTEIHAAIDPLFRRYFEPGQAHEIRYDEIVWGGVRQNGIPPLRDPIMVEASEAAYLEGDNIVFGIIVGGKAYAYPQRILAWHEMFVTTLDGIPLVGVYCTLCGSVILYETQLEGTEYQLGTSGFLYRSNKLMFDETTHSLWSTLRGEPVVGPLVGKGIQLKQRSVVTTTWKLWLERYPKTLVLSDVTGHRRDYSEGAAYREYFATDRLMFPVPFDDQRLRNKAEILGLRLGPNQRPLAISIDSLEPMNFFEGQFNDISIIVLRDQWGIIRAYQTESALGYGDWDGGGRYIDSRGQSWRLEESGLTNKLGKRLPRIPSHRAFWFGWHAAYPETTLISGETVGP